MTAPAIERGLRAIAERPRDTSEVAAAAGVDRERLRKSLHWLRRAGHLRYAGCVWRLANRDVDSILSDWRARCA